MHGEDPPEQAPRNLPKKGQVTVGSNLPVLPNRCRVCASLVGAGPPVVARVESPQKIHNALLSRWLRDGLRAQLNALTATHAVLAHRLTWGIATRRGVSTPTRGVLSDCGTEHSGG